MSDSLIALSGREFLDSVASSAPAPGGGSAAAWSGALGCALGAMVCELSIGRKKYAEFEAELVAARDVLNSLRAELSLAVDSDAAAYDAVSDAYKAPKDDMDARSQLIQKALIAAANSPLMMLKKIAAAADTVASIYGKSNANAASDLGTASSMLRSGADGALLNVLINVGGIADEAAGGTLRREAEAIYEHASEACERVFNGIRDGMN